MTRTVTYYQCTDCGDPLDPPYQTKPDDEHLLRSAQARGGVT